MTSKEALRNIGEILYTKDKATDKHLMKLSEKILDKEVPFNQTDFDLDRKWYEETHEE